MHSFGLLIDFSMCDIATYIWQGLDWRYMAAWSDCARSIECTQSAIGRSVSLLSIGTIEMMPGRKSKARYRVI